MSDWSSTPPGSAPPRQTPPYVPSGVPPQGYAPYPPPYVPQYPPQGGPTYQQPTYQQPVYQQPTYQQPPYQQPVYQQPMYSQAILPPDPIVRGGVSVAGALLCAVGFGLMALYELVSLLGGYEILYDLLGERTVYLAVFLALVAAAGLILLGAALRGSARVVVVVTGSLYALSAFLNVGVMVLLFGSADVYPEVFFSWSYISLYADAVPAAWLLASCVNLRRYLKPPGGALAVTASALCGVIWLYTLFMSVLYSLWESGLYWDFSLPQSVYSVCNLLLCLCMVAIPLLLRRAPQDDPQTR